MQPEDKRDERLMYILSKVKKTTTHIWKRFNLISLGIRVKANNLIDPLYSMLKYLNSDGETLFLDDNASFHRTWRLTK